MLTARSLALSTGLSRTSKRFFSSDPFRNRTQCNAMLICWDIAVDDQEKMVGRVNSSRRTSSLLLPFLGIYPILESSSAVSAFSKCKTFRFILRRHSSLVFVFDFRGLRMVEEHTVKAVTSPLHAIE